MRREEKIFIAWYKCRCCGEWIKQKLYVPKQIREFRSTEVRDLPLWEMYEHLEKTVPKIRLDNCQCTDRGKTVQELLNIVENED